MEISEQKAFLRKEIRQKRKQLTEAEIRECSAKALVRLLQMPEYVCCHSVFTYVSYEQELSTIPLIKAAFLDGKKVAVPKVVSSRHMEFFYIADLSELKRGYCGILEPEGGEPVFPDRNSLMVLPGMLFDENGNRMGYGGGFYDEYLARLGKEGKPLLLGYAYDFQMFGKETVSEAGFCGGRFPAQSHDQKADRVITPSKIFFCGSV